MAGARTALKSRFDGAVKRQFGRVGRGAVCVCRGGGPAARPVWRVRPSNRPAEFAIAGRQRRQRALPWQPNGVRPLGAGYRAAELQARALCHARKLRPDRSAALR